MNFITQDPHEIARSLDGELSVPEIRELIHQLRAVPTAFDRFQIDLWALSIECRHGWVEIGRTPDLLLLRSGIASAAALIAAMRYTPLQVAFNWQISPVRGNRRPFDVTRRKSIFQQATQDLSIARDQWRQMEDLAAVEAEKGSRDAGVTVAGLRDSVFWFMFQTALWLQLGIGIYRHNTRLTPIVTVHRKGVSNA